MIPKFFDFRQAAQVAIVTEAVHACACFVKMNPEEVENPNNDIMKIIMDAKLSLFTSDKFLGGLSGPALKSLCLVAEKVVFYHPGSNEKWLKAIAMGLAHNEGPTRAMASVAIKRLGSILAGLETLRQVGDQLNDHIWQHLDRDPDLVNDNLKVGNVKLAVVSLCKAVSSDGTLAMALILMPICHHPAVWASDKDLWIRSCKRLKVEPSE